MYRVHCLGSGEVLPLGACHWVGDDDGLHSGHGVRLPTGGFPIFSHDPLFFDGHLRFEVGFRAPDIRCRLRGRR